MLCQKPPPRTRYQTEKEAAAEDEPTIALEAETEHVDHTALFQQKMLNWKPP